MPIRPSLSWENLARQHIAELNRYGFENFKLFSGRNAGRSPKMSASTELKVVKVQAPKEVLEPCAGKLARTVPRGRETGNRLLLPGASAGAKWNRVMHVCFVRIR